jgi:hypothetical protein
VDKDKLQEILVKHERWLNDDEGGERADLREADLRGANLRGADLRRANLQWVDLRGANLRWAKLQGADLRGAHLRGAKLQGADLQGADLDFSVWPLWCGSREVKADNRLVYQLVAHICGLDCNTPEFKKIKEFLLPYAKQSHRAVDLGLGELNER